MNYVKKFQIPVKSLMVMHSGFGIRSVTSVLSKRVLIHGSEMNDISFGEMSKQVFLPFLYWSVRIGMASAV